MLSVNMTLSLDRSFTSITGGGAPDATNLARLELRILHDNNMALSFLGSTDSSTFLADLLCGPVTPTNRLLCQSQADFAP
jgi:hypothetical protein